MSVTGLKPLVVVITGVTRGLGRAMVDEFDRLGHTVLGCARSKDQIKELGIIFPKHDFQTVDVASNSAVKAWAARLLVSHGTPDFVLNNAAVINSKALLWKVRDEEFSQEIDINIKGVANVVRHFVPSMVRRKRGVIVNLSSRWGNTVEMKMAPYCATKWAVVALTQVLAAELEQLGVVAVGLNPGIVKTQMLRRYMGNSAASNYPEPSDWAKIAVPLILRFQMKDSGKIRRIKLPFKTIVHRK